MMTERNHEALDARREFWGQLTGLALRLTGAAGFALGLGGLASLSGGSTMFALVVGPAFAVAVYLMD